MDTKSSQTTDADKWSKAKKHLRCVLTKKTYEMCIAPAVLVAVEEHRVVVAVPAGCAWLRGLQETHGVARDVFKRARMEFVPLDVTADDGAETVEVACGSVQIRYHVLSHREIAQMTTERLTEYVEYINRQLTLWNQPTDGKPQWFQNASAQWRGALNRELRRIRKEIQSRQSAVDSRQIYEVA